MIRVLFSIFFLLPLCLKAEDFGQVDICTVDTCANDQFVWEMAHDIPHTLGSNLLISPQSCWHALSLVYLGAEGSTRQDLESVVNPFELDRAEFATFLNKHTTFLNPECCITSALFVSPTIPIRSEYQQALVTAGLSEVTVVDFENPQETVESMNGWVTKSTQGKIAQLVAESDIDAETQAFLVSALHFKASWQSPFRFENTKLEPFYLPLDVFLEVPMMRQVHYFYSASQDGFEYVSLPYRSEGKTEWEMELILTPQCGLEEPVVESTILHTLRSQAHRKRIDIRLPRFKAMMRWDIRASMEKKGITIPFSDRADFSSLSDRTLKIDKVFQECCVDVTEEGTEGAAATAVGLVSRRRPEEPYVVVFDRPFYFVVREKVSGTVLFFGRIENP